jgi:glycosyltransferase involved in cell wall biosynthesis
MNDWHGPWMNRQQLLSRLGKKHDIIFSNGLLSIWDRHTELWKRSPLVFNKYIHDHDVHVHKAPKLLARIPKWTNLDKLILRIGIHLVKKYLNRIGSGPTVAYIFNPEYASYVKLLRPDYLVYHAYDLYSKTPGWNQELADQQEYLLNNANLVIASSEKIANQLESISGKAVTVLPNAADYEAFKTAFDHRRDMPEDMRGIPEPRIAYIGNINRKVDLPLIADLAYKHRNWHFVIVGGIGNLDSDTGKALEQCQNLANVHFLGAKTYKELPTYLSYMHIALMCYRIEDSLWTEGIYPLKMHEYLSAGLPVISADIPSVREFDHVIEIVRNIDEWECAISGALNKMDERHVSARRKVARENSWSKRADRLEALLQDMIKS